jgi:hypothetical protein
MFKFLDTWGEDKWFWTESYQAFPVFILLLISSWMRFWSVTIVPTYSNFATISNDLLDIFM